MAFHDVYFAWILVFGAVVLGSTYGVRVAVRGAARSDRVDKIGGTVLVGRGLMEWAYWLLNPVVRGLAAIGVTPNLITWCSLALGAGAGVALACDMFGLACLLATMSTLGDVLDGQIARLTNTGSDKGELLDAAVDRYTEFFFLFGLLVHYRDSVLFMALTMAALMASFMISYASAKAEALQQSPPRGLMRRHERAIYLLSGAGLSSLFGDWLHDRWTEVPQTAPQLVALAAVAVIGNYAAVQRFVRIGRALR